jgi:hypothetical protein
VLSIPPQIFFAPEAAADAQEDISSNAIGAGDRILLVRNSSNASVG